MGELDKKQKVYFEDPRKFADVWNALVYEGEQVVSWKGLRECSPVLVHAEGEGIKERTPDVCMKQTANDEEWDGARSLHELIDFGGAEWMRELVPEFRLRMYDMSNVEHLERFRTDVGTLVGLYQRKGDKEAFREFGSRAEVEGGGRKLDELGMEVLGILVKSKRLMKLLDTKKEKEELTMCKAIDDIYEEGREEGIKEGIKEGREDERKNTLREAARADIAEKENIRLKNLLDKAGIAY